MRPPAKSLEFCRRALEDRDAFWASQAELIHWNKPFRKVSDFSEPPFVKWFPGGETNLCYNAIDRHLNLYGDAPALHYLSTEVDAEHSYTFRELYGEVCRFAAVLRSLGLRRGDRVLIYLPMIPEAAFAMLACVRIGLIHSVVFAGFAPASLATRIDDAEAKLLVTADAGLRGGKLISLKQLADQAIALAKHKPDQVLVCNRGIDREMQWCPGRDLDYTELRNDHLHAEIEPVWLESQEVSYLLYTSGTTASPKGIQRDTGGYAVAMASSMRHVFAGEPAETIFTAADIGWAVGHSYGVYGPLIHGMQTILYRLGTREIEETVSTHPAVAEVATVGARDELKGQAVHCFVVLKNQSGLGSPEAEAVLKKEIEETVVRTLGSFARPAAIYIVRMLPKTRSGKILRRAILAAAERRDTGDLSTLEDPVALDALKEIIGVTMKAPSGFA